MNSHVSKRKSKKSMSPMWVPLPPNDQSAPDSDTFVVWVPSDMWCNDPWPGTIIRCLHLWNLSTKLQQQLNQNRSCICKGLRTKGRGRVTRLRPKEEGKSWSQLLLDLVSLSMVVLHVSNSTYKPSNPVEDYVRVPLISMK